MLGQKHEIRFHLNYGKYDISIVITYKLFSFGMPNN